MSIFLESNHEFIRSNCRRSDDADFKAGAWVWRDFLSRRAGCWLLYLGMTANNPAGVN